MPHVCSKNVVELYVHKKVQHTGSKVMWVPGHLGYGQQINANDPLSVLLIIQTSMTCAQDQRALDPWTL